MFKQLVKAALPVIDVLIFPFVYLAAVLMKSIRIAGVQRLPFTKRALLNVGVFPIRSHYYEPLFDFSSLREPLSKDRLLPGIDWNVDE